MESISVDIMKNLENQTNQMNDTDLRVVHLNKELSQSGSLISKMLRREYRSKLVIGGLALITTLILGVVILIKLNV